MKLYRAIDSTAHLCDFCARSCETPLCWGDNLEFGDGRGNDNIIACPNFTGELNGKITEEEKT